MGGNGSKIVITGPPKAGKTTILHKLKLGKPVNETVVWRDVAITVSDDTNGAAAVIVVVDATRPACRLPDCDVPVLVFANKQDAPGAVTPNELIQTLGLVTYPQRWHVQGSCALTGDGLYEGLDWISATLADFSDDDDLVCITSPVHILFGPKTANALSDTLNFFKR